LGKTITKTITVQLKPFKSMQKDALNKGMSYLWLPPKLLLIMKLVIIIMIATLTQLSAAGFAQKVSLNEKNIPLHAVIEKIRTQTNYDFVFKANIFDDNDRISLNLKNVNLDEALNVIFKNSNISFTIKDKVIVLDMKNKSFIDKLIDEFKAIDVRGTVLDEKKLPLPGATVRVKGTNKRVTTNAAGKFFLQNVAENATIEISYIGYKVVEVIAASQIEDVTLTLEDADLKEVIVTVSTGYQILPKDRVSGSFKVISGEQLEKPAADLSQKLIGTTSGMVATTSPVTGESTFQIRGLSTLGANASPLIVVNGFALSENNFSNINPNDIETVTILKDAGAASIWGARAANGVIVVTTKTAKKGMPLSIEINAFTRIASKLDLNYSRALASSAATVDYEVATFGKLGAQTNAGILGAGSTWSNFRSQATTLLNENRLGFISSAQLATRLDVLRMSDNSAQISDLLMSNPVTNQINLNMASATEKVRNNMSLQYETNQQDFKGNNNTRALINYRAVVDITDWLRFDTEFNGLYANQNNDGYDMTTIRSWSPYDMLLKPDGTPTNFTKNYYYPIIERYFSTSKFPYADFTYNPLTDLSAHNLTAQTLNARLQAGLTFKIMPGVSVNSRFRYENNNILNRGLYNESSDRVRTTVNQNAVWDRTMTGVVTPLIPKGSILDQSRSKSVGYTWANQVNVDRTFGNDHSINVLLGQEMRQLVSQNFNHSTTYGYNDETLQVGAFSNGTGGSYPLAPTYRISSWTNPGGVWNIPTTVINGISVPTIYNSFPSFVTDRFVSLYANAAYTYKNKYTIEAGARVDASNLITDEAKYRYQPIWHVGGTWQIYKEHFMGDINWIDNFSLRGTFGYQGNIDRSTSFMPLIALGGVNNNTNETSNTISSYGNPSLRWEKTAQTNVGIDFSVLKGKLFGSLDLYNKNGRDLIASIAIPAVNGTTSQRLNRAEMVNRGLNLELGTNLKIAEKIRWSGSFNFGYNKNKITQLYATAFTYGNLTSTNVNSTYVQEHNANTLWVPVYAGLVNGYPAVRANDGSTFPISSAPGSVPDARTILTDAGTNVAPYTGGLTSSFDVYNFNLSFTITGKFGAVFKTMPFNYPPGSGSGTGRILPNARLDIAYNGDPSQYVQVPPSLVESNYLTWLTWSNNFSYLVQNANVIRIQQVDLSYRVNPRLLGKLNIKGLKLFAQGTNLFVFTNNKYDEDPEYPLGTQRPMPRFTFGANLQF
jgi:TonB-linked SusC/RagA family outer membrane protein